MTRFTRGGSCKPEGAPPPIVAAARVVPANESPNMAESATLPMPAADVPKKWRRVTR
jgi:hypothetical protein